MHQQVLTGAWAVAFDVNASTTRSTSSHNGIGCRPKNELPTSRRPSRETQFSFHSGVPSFCLLIFEFCIDCIAMLVTVPSDSEMKQTGPFTQFVLTTDHGRSASPNACHKEEDKLEANLRKSLQIAEQRLQIDFFLAVKSYH